MTGNMKVLLSVTVGLVLLAPPMSFAGNGDERRHPSDREVAWTLQFSGIEDSIITEYLALPREPQVGADGDILKEDYLFVSADASLVLLFTPMIVEEGNIWFAVSVVASLRRNVKR